MKRVFVSCGQRAFKLMTFILIYSVFVWNWSKVHIVLANVKLLLHFFLVECSLIWRFLLTISAVQVQCFHACTLCFFWNNCVPFFFSFSYPCSTSIVYNGFHSIVMKVAVRYWWAIVSTRVVCVWLWMHASLHKRLSVMNNGKQSLLCYYKFFKQEDHVLVQSCYSRWLFFAVKICVFNWHQAKWSSQLKPSQAKAVSL